jgi:lipoate-protein ligase A
MSLIIYPYIEESGPENMATDYSLFQEINSTDPIFRHYGWHNEEITFGYGQNWSWVSKQEIIKSRNITRRPTGGGIVKHGQDWTYMLILPNGHSSFLIPALDLYEKIHRAIGKALGQLGHETTLKPCPQKSEIKAGIPGNCFLEPVGRDLMSSNGTTKLAGAAMKRTKKGILVQGTIELSGFFNLDLEQLKTSLFSEIEKLVDEKAKVAEWPKGYIDSRACYVEQFSSSSWRENRKIT